MLFTYTCPSRDLHARTFSLQYFRSNYYHILFSDTFQTKLSPYFVITTMLYPVHYIFGTEVDQYNAQSSFVKCFCYIATHKVLHIYLTFKLTFQEPFKIEIIAFCCLTF